MTVRRVFFISSPSDEVAGGGEAHTRGSSSTCRPRLERRPELRYAGASAIPTNALDAPKRPAVGPNGGYGAGAFGPMLAEWR